MKLTKKELAATGNLAAKQELDQSARYRDIHGRTLTEIHQSKVDYTLNPKREGLVCYDNAFAELEAKNADPRYTQYNRHDNAYQSPRQVAARKEAKL